MQYFSAGRGHGRGAVGADARVGGERALHVRAGGAPARAAPARAPARARRRRARVSAWNFSLYICWLRLKHKMTEELFTVSVTLYPAQSRVGRGNLVLRYFVPHTF